MKQSLSSKVEPSGSSFSLRLFVSYPARADKTNERKKAVSYTHLDVYKRQGIGFAGQQLDTFGIDLENAASVAFDDLDILFGQQTILRLVTFDREWFLDRKSTRLNSSHSAKSRMPSSA